MTKGRAYRLCLCGTCRTQTRSGRKIFRDIGNRKFRHATKRAIYRWVARETDDWECGWVGIGYWD